MHTIAQYIHIEQRVVLAPGGLNVYRHRGGKISMLKSSRRTREQLTYTHTHTSNKMVEEKERVIRLTVSDRREHMSGDWMDSFSLVILLLLSQMCALFAGRSLSFLFSLISIFNVYNLL